MNQRLHDLADSIFESDHVSEQDEFNFIQHILDNSQYTSLDEFCTAHITAESAQDLVFAKDDVMQDYVSNNELSFDLIVESIQAVPATFAYNLAIATPELATALLDALMYYRTAGRI
jgi:hypothetical protein